jgi:hypothetical protein
MSLSSEEWELHCVRAWRDHYAELVRTFSMRLVHLSYHDAEGAALDAAASGEYGDAVAGVLAGCVGCSERAWAEANAKLSEAQANLFNAEQRLSELETRAESGSR